MQLSKIGYFADFGAYPALALALSAAAFRPPESLVQVKWLIACAMGAAGWTLAEYLIHRFCFHRLPVIARMHDMHHARPSALIGAPLWSSLSVFGFGVFIPLWWLAGARKRCYDGFDHRISLVRDCSYCCSSLASGSIVVPLPGQAASRPTSSWQARGKFRCDYLCLGSCFWDYNWE
jgi:hypothetical protein